jgi:hypothetical protein
MMAVQTPADLKLAQALAESQERLDQEDRKIAAARQGKVDLVLVDIEAIAKRIDEAVHRTISDVLKIGKGLDQAHEKFGGLGRDGQFRTWVEDRFGFTVKTAYNYMDVFRVFGRQKCERLSHFSLEALYKLSSRSCPVLATAKALEMADRGERVTLQAAKSLVKDHVEAVDDDGDDYHIDATNGVVADSPRVIEGHFGSDATVTAGGSSDEDPPAESGVEIEQLQDAFDTYVLPQLAKASPAVRKKFLAWVAKT